jgi:hypothetical protein
MARRARPLQGAYILFVQRIVVEISRAMHSPYNAQHESAMVVNDGVHSVRVGAATVRTSRSRCRLWVSECPAS